MALFKRTARMKVGKFKPPPEREPASLERLVEEGLLIADSALRMTLKNAIIVAALRDRRALDRDALHALAVERLGELAEGERAAAGRDRLEIGSGARRREQVRHALAERLAALAADSERIAAVVERSRASAWEEISGPLADRASAAREAERALTADLDPEQRAERVAAFVALDLTSLAAERGVDLVAD